MAWKKIRICVFVCAFFACLGAFLAFSQLKTVPAGDGFRASGTLENAVEISENVPARTQGTLRIASLNCFNYLCGDRYVDKKYKRRWPKPQAEREAIWEIVKIVNPDIIALQEIGGEAQVAQLQADLARAGVAFPHRAVLSGRDISRRNAIISRVPVEKIYRFPETEMMTRGLLGIVVSAGKLGGIAVFTVHLKSRIARKNAPVEDFECNAERQREAKTVKKRLAGTSEPFVLLGDFNDVPASPPLQTLAQNNFLLRLDARDATGARWTYRNDKHGYEHTFDHILIVPALAKHVVPASALIVEKSISKRASDHRMVYFDLKID